MFEMTIKDPNRAGRRLMDKWDRGSKASERKFKATSMMYERREARQKAVARKHAEAHQRALDRGSRLAWAKEPAEKRPWAKV